jgi:hypothetical protein
MSSNYGRRPSIPHVDLGASDPLSLRAQQDFERSLSPYVGAFDYDDRLSSSSPAFNYDDRPDGPRPTPVNPVSAWNFQPYQPAPPPDTPQDTGAGATAEAGAQNAAAQAQRQAQNTATIAGLLGALFGKKKPSGGANPPPPAPGSPGAGMSGPTDPDYFTPMGSGRGEWGP